MKKYILLLMMGNTLGSCTKITKIERELIESLEQCQQLRNHQIIFEDKVHDCAALIAARKIGETKYNSKTESFEYQRGSITVLISAQAISEEIERRKNSSSCI